MGNKSDLRGGKRYFKVQQQHKEHMVQLIENQPRATLADIADSLNSKFGLRISKTTVSRHLDALAYTLKSIRYEPERANLNDNKLKRKKFAELFLLRQSKNIPILFIDETNINLHISRDFGRSLRGTRCSTVAAGSRGIISY